MTVNGQPEPNNEIENEEHQHEATAKRTILVASDGSLIGTAEPLQVYISGATISASISVELDKDDDSVTCWQPTGSNFNAQVTGTVLATVTGTVTVDNFPAGFTNTISGTVSNTVLGGTLDNITSTLKATVYQGTSPWIASGTFTGTVNATILGGQVNSTITNTINSTVYQGTDPWNVTANDGAGSLASTEGTFVVTTASATILYSATTNRAGFFVQNQGDNDVYFGFTSSVSTTSNYFAKLTSGESADWAFTNTIYTIAATANSTISHGGV